MTNCENFDDGLTQVAPEGEFRMKTKEQIINKWKEELIKIGILTRKHINSKKTKEKDYVTKEEHITGERLSSEEGYLLALEWVLNEDINFYERLLQEKN